jgi:hypothetical protein
MGEKKYQGRRDKGKGLKGINENVKGCIQIYNFFIKIL